MIDVDHAMPELREFVRESNRIEGIKRVREVEVLAHGIFLQQPRISVQTLEGFVRVLDPEIALRSEPGMNVRVGHHRPPPGGPDIKRHLEQLLDQVNKGADAYEMHHAYEKLHPFMDGNGRSGRVLWLWQICTQTEQGEYALLRGFLHSWYYQSLNARQR